MLQKLNRPVAESVALDSPSLPGSSPGAAEDSPETAQELVASLIPR